MNNGDTPASPTKPVWGKCYDEGYDGSGLTKREHFAAMALQGMLTNTSVSPTNKVYATVAVSLADALLKALEE